MKRGARASRLSPSSSLAKLTAPTLPIILERRRLFRELDQAKRRPIVWVLGGPGMGKTTLIASYQRARKLNSIWYQCDAGDADPASFFHYLGLAAPKDSGSRTSLPHLTPEYALGVSTFTRRFFQEFYARLRTPCVMVFDNFQNIPGEHGFHELMQVALNAIPDGITIIIISRMSPPPAFARLQALQAVSILDGDRLRLTADESNAIIRLHARHTGWKISKALLDHAHRKTQGWVAGLVLMLEQLRAQGTKANLLEDHPPQAVFDYLASEVLQTVSPETQDALCKCGFLPTMTIGMAEKLTSLKSIGQVLESLYRERYFTERRFEREAVYQYHPMFREFLLSRAKSRLADELAEIQRRAAHLLAEAGQLEDAADLLRDAGQWDELVNLVLSNAAALMSQGRSQTLAGWLTCLPEEVLEHNPWLRFWLGVARAPLNFTEARDHLKWAFAGFEKLQDVTGMLLAWCGIVESILFEWNDKKILAEWLERLDKILPDTKRFPSPAVEARVTAVMVASTLFHRPSEASLQGWLDRARTIADPDADPTQTHLIKYQLALYYTLLGEPVEAELWLRSMRDSLPFSSDALPRLFYLMAEAIYSCFYDIPEKGLDLAAKGLSLSETSGIYLFYDRFLAEGVYGSLLAGDVRRAEDFLHRMELKGQALSLFDRQHYHHLMTWLFLLKSDPARARHHAAVTLDAGSRTGIPYSDAVDQVAMAQALWECDDRSQAKQYLDEGMRLSHEAGSSLAKWLALLTKAYFAFQEDDEGAGHAALREAMSLARSKRLLNFNVWRPAVMAELCVRALDAGIEVDYVQSVIRRRHLFPEAPPLAIAAWPWPVKITTLGKFACLKDDAPLQFTRKTQRRPLDLLKAAIAFGGREVPQDLLTDALWPDAEGDAGHQAFATTLHRLRKLLGYEDIIELRDGLLSLRQIGCWLDTWTFEHLLAEAEAARTAGNQDSSRHLNQQALAIYQGAFLAGDETAPWTHQLRDRLRNKFIRTTLRLARQWEERDDFDRSAECLNKALDIDEQAEGFYAPLMHVLYQVGHRAQALELYDRYQQVISPTLGLQPPQEMQRLYQALRTH
jgi:LuxR family transcriptional regulator, maltose regulon positive regulatory protein